MEAAALKRARTTGNWQWRSKNATTLPEALWHLYDPSFSSGNTKSTAPIVDFNAGDSDRWWESVELTHFDVCDNALDQLDERLTTSFPALVSIDAQRNRIEYVPNSIDQLHQLATLNLSMNRLKDASLPPCLFVLPSLVQLGLAGNQLTLLPSLKSLPQLQVLDVSQNQLTTLPDVSGCVRLTVLRLQENRLSGSILPGVLDRLTLLDELDLKRNALETVDLSLNVTRLDLRYNQLTNVRLHLPRCRDLMLAFNRLSSLAGATEQCPLLKSLDVRDNRLQEIHESVCQLKELERLDLTNNDIKQLSPELGLLSLNAILLDGNPIRGVPRNGSTMAILKWLRSKMEVPDEVTNALASASLDDPQQRASKTWVLSKQKLTNADLNKRPVPSYPVLSADFSFNQLTSVPEAAAWSETLETWVLSNNGIQLSHKFPSLFHLRTLNLACNKVNDLPTGCFIALPSLDHLDLSYNQLAYMPSGVFPPSLTVLLLGSNQIQELDPFSLPEALKTLDVSNNAIQRLSPELALLRSLQVLKVEGNVFRQPRQAIVTKGSAAVLEYLRNQCK